MTRRTPRPLALLATMTLMMAAAGCLDGSADAAEEARAAADAAAPPAPAAFVAEGVAWLPPSEGQERARTEIPFDVNASGMGGLVALRLGERWLVEVPTSIAHVNVEVRDAEDGLVASTELHGLRMEDALELADLAPGPHQLVLLSYGGSDGGMGEYVAWRIELGAA